MGLNSASPKSRLVSASPIAPLAAGLSLPSKRPSPLLSGLPVPAKAWTLLAPTVSTFTVLLVPLVSTTVCGVLLFMNSKLPLT